MPPPEVGLWHRAEQLGCPEQVAGQVPSVNGARAGQTSAVPVSHHAEHSEERQRASNRRGHHRLEEEHQSDRRESQCPYEDDQGPANQQPIAPYPALQTHHRAQLWPQPHRPLGSAKPDARRRSAKRLSHDGAGRGPCALANFGFGGKIVVMFPRHAVGLNVVGGCMSGSRSASGRQNDRIRGPLLIYTILATTRHLRSTMQYTSFPGPLAEGVPKSAFKERAVLDFMAEQSADCASVDGKTAASPTNTNAPFGDGCRYLSPSGQMLWDLLTILVKTRGRIRSDGGGGIRGQRDEDDDDAASLMVHMLDNAANGSRAPERGPGLRQRVTDPAHGGSEAMEKIGRLLVSGDKEGAAVAAVEAKMWAHAMCISSIVSATALRRIMSRFVRESYCGSDPVRTVLLIFCGQGAAAIRDEAIRPDAREMASCGHGPGGSKGGGVNCGVHEGGGACGVSNARKSTPRGHEGSLLLRHWYDHLRAILLNRTPGDAAVITALGDRLWAEAGDVDAAHVCYLVAGGSIEAPESEEARIVLIGGDHRRTESDFSYMNAAAIQRSEIFEYAHQLGNSQYVLPFFQPYKLMYAMQLADLGMAKAARAYCSCIKATVRAAGGILTDDKNKRPGPFSDAFISQLMVFDDRVTGAQDGGVGAAAAEAAGYVLKRASSWILGSVDAGVKRLIRGGNTQSMPPQEVSKGDGWPVRKPATGDCNVANSLQEAFAAEGGDPHAQVTSDAGPAASSTLTAGAATHALARNLPHNKSSHEATSVTKQKPNSRDKPRKGGTGSGWLSSKMQKWFLPKEAKVAKGLGKTMEAYYDDTKKRWIFPGEEDVGDKPSLPPPPPTALSDLAAVPPVAGFTSRHVADNSAPPPPNQPGFFSGTRRNVARSRYAAIPGLELMPGVQK